MDNLDAAAERVAKGDTAAFRVIVEQTSDALVRLSARIMGNVADAEDVVQEAFVKAYGALSARKFDGRSSIKTWLYRIVTHSAIDALRSRSRREPVDDGAPFGGGWETAHQAEAHLALAELSDWVGTLPPDQRVAIVLQAVEGLSTAEIAEITDSTQGAVEQRLVRARATLRQKRSAS